MSQANGSDTRARSEQVCIALDLHDRDVILGLVDELGDLAAYFKLNSAFTLFGPELVRAIKAKGAKVFLDLKLHDIPNTLAGYGEAITRLGADIVTVHTEGGLDMLRAFVRSVAQASARLSVPRPKLVGISLLTSIDQQVLNTELNVLGKLEDEVVRRGRLAADAGLDGLVCSAAELAHVKSHLPPSFYYVTPGVRPSSRGGDDHKRTASAASALRAGSNLLVVGRSVVDSPDRRAALLSLHASLGEEA